ncbi:hypothetical protein CR513_35085, partial [Mucuna pruriens]
MEDDTSGKGSTLILGQLFLMTARTKIDVHAGMLSVEFGDNLVQFNIFEVTKHPTEDHSLFGIDVIDELVVEHLQLEAGSAEFPNFTEDIDVISCLGSVTYEFDCDKLWEVQDLFDSKDDTVDLAHLDLNSEFVAESDSSNHLRAEFDSGNQSQKQQKAETDLAHQEPNLPRLAFDVSPLHSPPIELKPLPGHLKYAYLDNDKQFPIIVANNLHQEKEEKLL